MPRKVIVKMTKKQRDELKGKKVKLKISRRKPKARNIRNVA